MMDKVVSELIVHMHANWVPGEQKGEEPIESTSGLLAKNPPEVKSMIDESKV